MRDHRGFCRRCRMRRRLSRETECCRRCDAVRTDAEIALIDNSVVERTQMLSIFVDDHYEFGTEPRHEYLKGFFPTISRMDVAASPLLRTAVDTLCCAHLGHTSQSTSLLQKAQSDYGNLLQSLTRVVNSTPALQLTLPFKHRDVLTALMMLAVLGLYDNPLPPQERIDFFMMHLKGAQLYLRSKGPKALDWSSEIDRVVYENLRTTSLLFGIAAAEPEVFAGLNWKDYTRRIVEANFFAGAAQFHELIEPIPNLLRRLEGFERVSQGGSEEATALSEEIAKLQSSMEEWYPREAQFEIVDARDVVHLDYAIEEHFFIASNSTFQRFYRFEGPTTARELVLCWTICLILECASVRLFAAWPGLRSRHEREQAMTRALYISKAMCNAVWYMSQMPSLAYAKFMNVFISMAETVFEEGGASCAEERHWTGQCLQAIDSRVARLLSANKRTLCCVDEIGPGFVRGCRWQPAKLIAETEFYNTVASPSP